MTVGLQLTAPVGRLMPEKRSNEEAINGESLNKKELVPHTYIPIYVHVCDYLWEYV